MRVLVTGAAGMLGRDLVAHLEGRHAVTGVDIEVDIRDAATVAALVRDVGPDAVINCAAVTDVDGSESAESDAYLVNALGAGNVAAAAAAVGAAMVQVSTDYVFPGGESDYAEDDPVNPAGAYGRTKLAGELAARCMHPGGARVARTAWLYGEHGRNFVDTMLTLAADRDEVAVVADQVGCPTWTRDLAPALEALITLPAGVYHTVGAGSTSWADLARRVFTVAGVGCRVRDITTAELGRPAPRPSRSVLRVTRPGAPRLRDWDAALVEYLTAKGTR